jgi:LPS sulfotransferase NodH
MARYVQCCIETKGFFCLALRIARPLCFILQKKLIANEKNLSKLKGLNNMSFYLTCTTPRTGGNLLCSVLSDTGILGTPGSYVYAYPTCETLAKLPLNRFEDYLSSELNLLAQQRGKASLNNLELSWLYETKLLDKYGDAENRLRFFYEHLRAHTMIDYLHNIRKSPLGGRNWGIKVSANDSNGRGFDYFFQKLNSLSSKKNTLIKCLTDNFGEVKFIWLTRRNKVRQALSRWKAINTETWHSKYEKDLKSNKNQKPSIEELRQFVMQLVIDDSYWEEFFTQNMIDPLTVVYEDFINQPEKTLNSIYDYLDIDKKERSSFENFQYKKMASCSDEENLIEQFYDDEAIFIKKRFRMHST